MTVCFGINFFAIKPNYLDILDGFIPSVPTSLEFTGVIGSIIMPQNLFLQASLVMTRNKVKVPSRRLANVIKIETILIIILSFFINVFIVGVFGNPEFKDKTIELENAGQVLTSYLPSWSALIWAIGLFCSGVSSTTTGALTGQYLMEGIIKLKFPRYIRILITRLLTLFPCIFITIFFKVDEIIGLLNIVQFLQLPFVVIPLLRFVTNTTVMKSVKYTYKTAHIFVVAVLSIFLQIINVYSIKMAIDFDKTWKVWLFWVIVVTQTAAMVVLIFVPLEYVSEDSEHYEEIEQNREMQEEKEVLYEKL